MISVLTHYSEWFYVHFKNGLHLINKSSLQGLHINNK